MRGLGCERLSAWHSRRQRISCSRWTSSGRCRRRRISTATGTRCCASGSSSPARRSATTKSRRSTASSAACSRRECSCGGNCSPAGSVRWESPLRASGASPGSLAVASTGRGRWIARESDCFCACDRGAGVWGATIRCGVCCAGCCRWRVAEIEAGADGQEAKGQCRFADQVDGCACNLWDREADRLHDDSGEAEHGHREPRVGLLGGGIGGREVRSAVRRSVGVGAAGHAVIPLVPLIDCAHLRTTRISGGPRVQTFAPGGKPRRPGYARSARPTGRGQRGVSPSPDETPRMRRTTQGPRKVRAHSAF